MLVTGLFQLENITHVNGLINARVAVNPAHSIFEGHFPGQPVVPGVCMMQLVKELLEQAIGKTTRLTQAAQLKFLTVLDPRERTSIAAELTYSIVEGGIKVNANLSNENHSYFKLTAFFVTGP